MEEKILVAYASSSGSTQEIAEVVADTLRSNKMTVDLLPMRNVRTLDGYSAVVLGTSIYMFHLHKDAHHFLSQHRKALTGGLPTAVFAGGPISNGDEKEWQDVRSNVEQELARYAWFTPISVEIVGGKFDPTKLRLPWSLLPALRNMPASDLRDWVAIRAWADRISPALLQPT
jgi:menaquinone-dependent protoporphyrinogen oxidase